MSETTDSATPARPSQLRRLRPEQDVVHEQLRARARQALLGVPLETVRVGRYQLGDALGRGGMGSVFAARDEQLERDVAVKLLHCNGEDARRRLLREARALAKIVHPNVVEIFEAGTDGERVFLAMELVDGQTLGAWLRSGGHTVADVVDAFVQAGRGLEATHLAGVLHHDFKPDNALVAGDGRVRLVDFGVAGTAQASDRTGRVRTHDDGSASASTTASGHGGTPAYMAPERLAGKRGDVRSDQYSLCVALFEALYGKLPKDGEYEPAAEAGALAADQRVPARIRRALRRGLARDPDKRFDTLGELLTALTRPTLRAPVAAAALAGLIATAGVAFASVGDDRRCIDAADGASARLAEARPAIETNLKRDGGERGREAWERVDRRLDEQASGFAAAWAKACAAPEDPHFDARIECLRRGEVTMDTVVAELQRTEDDVAANGPTAVASLRKPSACLDVAEDVPAEHRKADAEIRNRVARTIAVESMGRFDAALVEAEDALAYARTTEAAAATAEAMMTAGRLQFRSGDFESAIALLEEGYWLASRLQRDRTAADAAVWLVTTLEAQGSYERAGEWVRHAQASLDRVEGPFPARAVLMHFRGNLAVSEGRFEDALKHYEDQLTMLDADPDADETDYGFTWLGLGNTLAGLGRLEEAKENFHRSLAALQDGLGPTHHRTALVHNALGSAIAMGGHIDEARPQFERALEIQRARPGVHREVATTLNNLANVAMYQGRNGDAGTYLDEVLAIRIELLGEDHAEVASTYCSVADTWIRRGEPEVALQKLRAGLDTFARSSAPDNPKQTQCLAMLGDLHVARGEDTEALAIYQRALEVAERSYGENSPRLIKKLFTLVAFHVAREHYGLAEPPHTRALAIAKAGMAPDNPMWARLWLSAGYIALGQAEPSKAVEHFEKAMELRSARQDGPPAELAEVQLGLGIALWDRDGGGDQAVQLVRAAVAGYRHAGDAYDGERAEGERWLAEHAPGGK